VERLEKIRAILEAKHRPEVTQHFDELSEECGPNTKNLLIAFATRVGINKVLMSKKSLLLIFATVNRSKGAQDAGLSLRQAASGKAGKREEATGADEQSAKREDERVPLRGTSHDPCTVWEPADLLQACSIIALATFWPQSHRTEEGDPDPAAVGRQAVERFWGHAEEMKKEPATEEPLPETLQASRLAVVQILEARGEFGPPRHPAADRSDPSSTDGPDQARLHGYTPKKPPDGWLETETRYHRGLRIEPSEENPYGGWILPMKCPLSARFAESVPESERFELGDLKAAVATCITEEACPGGLRAIVDLTNTNAYYDRNQAQSLTGALHHKLPVPGRTLPTEGMVEEFAVALNAAFQEQPGPSCVAVHCTHGVNRTGYFLCRYLLDHTAQCASGGVPAALALFAEVRGEPLNKAYLLEDLETRYAVPGETEPNPDEIEIGD